MKLSITALVLFCIPAAAWCAESPRFELTPLAGWQIGGALQAPDDGSDPGLHDAGMYGMIFNLRQEADSQWEVYLSRQSTRFDADPAVFGTNEFKLAVDYFHVGGNLSFDGPIGTPYIAATLGATRLRPDSNAYDSVTRFSFAIGGGLKVPISERVGTRVEVRALGTVMDNDSPLFCASDVDEGFCEIAVDGRILWQVAATAGITFRFR